MRPHSGSVFLAVALDPVVLSLFTPSVVLLGNFVIALLSRPLRPDRVVSRTVPQAATEDSGDFGRTLASPPPLRMDAQCSATFFEWNT